MPTILISPWVEKGAVIHEGKGPYKDSQYEHSSIPATIKKVNAFFCLIFNKYINQFIYTYL